VPLLAPRSVEPGDLALLVASAALAAGIVAYEVSGAILLGLDRPRPYIATQAVEGIGSLVAIAGILLLIAPSAAGMVVGAAAAYGAAAVFASIVAQRAVGGRMLGFDATFTRDALSMGLRGQIGNVLQFLNLRLDLLLVPLILDLASAGVYLIAVRMSEVVTQISSAAAALLFSAVARDGPTRTDLTERTTRATMIAVVVSGTAIAIAAEPLLTTFFGPEFGAAASALRITMIAMVPLAVSRLLAGDMKGRGRAGLVSISAGAALVATIALDLLLIPSYGIEGAALASLIAYTIGAVTLLIAYRRVTGASLRNLVPTFQDARLLGAALARAGRDAIRRT
jgi:O-antigen/teichoic acid export membrane protein